MPNSNAKGFTLIELLVVIAVVGVLSVIVLFAVNPGENLKKSRDSVRIQDITNIRKAIDADIADGAAVSLPLAACPYNTPCKSTASETRDADGTGWIPVNIQKYISVLPVDPRNEAGGVRNSAGNAVTLYYYFASDGQTYRLATYLESTANAAKTTGDGGTEPDMLEVGTNLTTDLATP